MELAADPVTGYGQLLAVGHYHSEVGTEDVDQGLLDGSHNLFATLDLKGGVEVGQRLIDLVERIADGVHQDQCPPNAEGLAVNLEGMVAGRVVYPEIAAERHELLVEHVCLTYRHERHHHSLDY